MAIQRYEGFDHFDQVAANPTDLTAKGLVYGAGSAFTYPAGQFAGQAIQLDAVGDVLTVPFPTAVNESFTGFWVQVAALPGAAFELCRWKATDGDHISLVLNPGGTLELFNLDPVVSLGTSTATLNINTWYHIETQLLIDDAAGVFRLRLDGVSEISSVAADTKANAVTSVDISAVQFNGDATVIPDIDDVIILDTTAVTGHPITFIGPSTVATLFPDGDGATSDFSQFGPGTANYDRVNESPGPDFDTSYVFDTVGGSIDEYTLQNIPGAYAGTAVLAVQCTMLAKKLEPGSKTVRTRMVSGSSTAVGTTHELSPTYKYTTPQIEAQDPDAGPGAWTQGTVNALNAGWELVT